MAVHLVAKVEAANMEPTVIYPIEQVDPERIALLTGVIQLVSAALERSGQVDSASYNPNFMKGERGVIGYCELDQFLIICETDKEEEADNVLRTIFEGRQLSDDELGVKLSKVVQKRGKEIGDLWS